MATAKKAALPGGNSVMPSGRPYAWEWSSNGSGGSVSLKLGDTGAVPFSLCLDFGRPLAKVSASVGPEKDLVAPRWEGSCVYFRAVSNEAVVSVKFAKYPAGVPSISHWEGV